MIHTTGLMPFDEIIKPMKLLNMDPQCGHQDSRADSPDLSMDLVEVAAARFYGHESS